MRRLQVALALLLFVFASLGGGEAIAAPPAGTAVDQARWAPLKKDVRLPNGIRLAYVDLGHNPNWERPESIAAAMKRFLAARR